MAALLYRNIRNSGALHVADCEAAAFVKSASIGQCFKASLVAMIG